MEHLFTALALVAAVGAGMNAGLFFIFSVAVMQGLAAISPASGIAAMQAINRVILNPWFFALFFGTALLALVLAVWGVRSWPSPAAGCLLGGGIAYLAGCIAVTMLRNVPLNNRLAAADAEAPGAQALWSEYLADWTWWNHVRTAGCAAAAVLFTLAYGALSAAP